MKIVKEFKEFAVRGSVMDLAVGIIIGGAFQKIVSSFVGDLVTPLLGILTGDVNFANLSFTLRPATDAHPALTLGYGAFAQNVIDFLIVACAVFLMVKGVNALRRKPQSAAEAPVPSAEEKLLTEIRDLLKAGARSRNSS